MINIIPISICVPNFPFQKKSFQTDNLILGIIYPENGKPFFQKS